MYPMTNTANTKNISDKKKQILDAAAELFPKKEFGGTSMRMIAAHAGVPQSLLHYYFQTKEGLFDAVVERYINQVNNERIRFIESFLDSKIEPDHSLEKLVTSLIQPWVEAVHHSDPITREFSKFIIRTAYRDDAWSQKLAVHHFGHVKELILKAFLKAVPEFTELDAFWAHFFTLSMFFMPLAAPKRMNKLANDKIITDDPEELLRHGVRFAIAGIKAMQIDAKKNRSHK